MALRVGGTISGDRSVHAEVDGSHHGYRIDGNGPDGKLVYLRATEACLFTVLVRLDCIGMYPGDDVWGRREVKICITPRLYCLFSITPYAWLCKHHAYAALFSRCNEHFRDNYSTTIQRDLTRWHSECLEVLLASLQSFMTGGNDAWDASSYVR